MGQPRKEKDALEAKARAVLTYLKSGIRYDPGHLPRPFMLEFTGSPSAGKTTTITELDKFLRRQGLRVLRPQEGAEVVRHIERTSPLYNIRTGLYALEMLIDISHGHLYDVVIFDRCIFDAYCWMEYWFEKGQLSESEKNDIQSLFLSRFFTDKLDAIYFMVADTDAAMERETRIALSTKFGETTNPKTVETLVTRYRTVYERLAPAYSQLVLVDTSSMSEEAMVLDIARRVMETLYKKAKSGH